MKEIWKDLGLTKKDTVLIQANVVHLMRKYKVKPKEILESILDSVGTAVFPAFNVDSVKGDSFGIFDIRNTPSRMGVLSETARNHPKAVRSGHPMFSFCAIGDKSGDFNVDNTSGYGKESPFAIIRRLNGKVMVINLPNSEGNSIIHHQEELEQVPYRFYKNFTGTYIDKYGQATKRTYSFYCNGGYKTLLDPLDNILWERKLYKGYKPHINHGCRVINSNDICNVVSEVIREDKAKGILYR